MTVIEANLFDSYDRDSHNIQIYDSLDKDSFKNGYKYWHKSDNWKTTVETAAVVVKPTLMNLTVLT